MPDTTLEEAKRCPKCQQPGDFKQDLMGQRRGSKVKVYICKNERCEAVNETWIVQVNADGSIPKRRPGPKEYPSADRMMTMGRHYVENLQEEVRRNEQ